MTRASVEASGTESASRVALLLHLFISGSETLGVSAIARELGLSKSVVHRILRTLVTHGFLAHDVHSREYKLGPAAVALGATALRSSDLRKAARPVLADLQQATGETVTLSGLVGLKRVYLDQIESSQEIKMTVELGRMFPLHAGSSGRVILAHLAEEQVDRLLDSELTRLTDDTIIDREELRLECARVREQGYAISRGERQSGATSIAAPVFDLDGHVTGSISICGPSHRVSVQMLQEISSQLVDHAVELSAALGFERARNQARTTRQPEERV